MGLYNTLHAQVTCRSCFITGPRATQYKYGECRLHDLAVGDKINWDEPGTMHGPRLAGRGWVSGFGDTCQHCGVGGYGADFAIIVENDTITELFQAPVGYCFQELTRSNLLRVKHLLRV